MSATKPGSASTPPSLLARLAGPVYRGSPLLPDAKMIVGLNLVYWVSAPLTMGMEVFTGNVPGLAVNVVVGLTSALTLLLVRAGQLRTAQWIWIFALSVFVNVASVASGGVHAGTYSANAVQVLLAAAFLGRTGAVAVFLVGLLGAIAGASVQPVWQESYWMATVIWGVVLGSIGVFGISLVETNQRRQEKLADQTRRLQETLDHLEASRVSRDYVASVLSALRELIVVTRPDGTIHSIARSASATGWSEAELVGKPLSTVLVANDGLILERSRDAHWIGPDGTKIPVVVSAGALPGGSRVWAATDISKLAATTTALRQAHDRARAANAAKSNFLANMSHELRTPLNAIIGYAELISDEVHDADTQDDLQRINGAAYSLLELINGVLDLSKVEAGKVSLHQSYFEVASILDPLVVMMEPIVGRRDITFAVSGDIEGDLVFADAGKLRQVLLNLLSNAAKYTDVGGIELRVQRWERDRLPWIRFVVEDTGVGMDPESLEVVFEPFVQARREEGEERQGTGLGLSICRAYVEMMGGQIYAESKEGKGSTFVVELPGERISAVSSRTTSLPIPEDVEDVRERVLVIDDDPEFLEFVTRTLLSDHRRVLATSDPHEGLAWADRFIADLIVLDVSMPDLSGWSFAVRLRKTRSKRAPVLVISGRDESEVAEALGCAAFVHKPVGASELQLRVDALLSNRA